MHCIQFFILSRPLNATNPQSSPPPPNSWTDLPQHSDRVAILRPTPRRNDPKPHRPAIRERRPQFPPFRLHEKPIEAAAQIRAKAQPPQHHLKRRPNRRKRRKKRKKSPHPPRIRRRLEWCRPPTRCWPPPSSECWTSVVECADCGRIWSAFDCFASSYGSGSSGKGTWSRRPWTSSIWSWIRSRIFCGKWWICCRSRTTRTSLGSR